MAASWGTSLSTVGGNQKPGLSFGASPPSRHRAPAEIAPRTCSATRSRWSDETSGPILPVHADAADTTRRSNSSKIESAT
eukprot:5215325-Pleurochrysis_carterae.AAC.3